MIVNIILFNFEIRDTNMLDSAIKIPRHPYYESLYYKAAALYRSLICNHPFVDGNKRIATVVLVLFLGNNQNVLVSSQKEVSDFALDISRGKCRKLEDISNWIKDRCYPLQSKESYKNAGIKVCNFTDRELLELLLDVFMKKR